jgi:hypothetical protein
MRDLRGCWLALAIVTGFGSSFAFAQEQHEASTSDLAKAAQNLIADMISSPGPESGQLRKNCPSLHFSGSSCRACFELLYRFAVSRLPD